jgi:hypothetical protein
MNQQVKISSVKETTHYENLVDQVPELLVDSQPPKPPIERKRFPKTIKVHTWGRGQTEKFCLEMGQSLSSDERHFVYNREVSDHPSYTENRTDPFTKRSTHKTRRESVLWTNTLDFSQDGWKPYITFDVTFEDVESYKKFCCQINQRLSMNTKSINYPPKKPKVWKYQWKSKWDNHQPQYPIYIVSKGRGDSRLTSRCLERLNIPYYIVIEPQDYDSYSCVIDPEKILVLPFSNHGDGPGRSRNWCWDHSMSLGHKRHWVMDDNIENFFRFHRGRKIPIGDGGMFRVLEEFVDRFKNVPISGLQYDFFSIGNSPYPPFVFNTRIYSCLLIDNSCPHRWRGRYNEDTILSLDVLKDGMCTIQFNNLLQGKSPTQNLGGGNTTEFYQSEGTWNKSIMLEKIHPDVCKTVFRYDRYHHSVNYHPFKGNEPIYVDGYDPSTNIDETSLFELEKVRIR